MVTPKGKSKKGGGKWTPLELDTDMADAKEQRRRFKLPFSSLSRARKASVPGEGTYIPEPPGAGTDGDAGTGPSLSDLGPLLLMGGLHPDSAFCRPALACNFPRPPGPECWAADSQPAPPNSWCPRPGCLEPKCLGFLPCKQVAEPRAEGSMSP